MSITPYVPPAFLTGLPTAIWSGVDGFPVLPFLPGQSITVTKSPLWSTQVIKSASGRRRTTAYWPFPLWQFELQYEVVRHRAPTVLKPTQDELAILWEFFNTAQGQYGSWLFVDPYDCQTPTSALQDPATGAVLTDPGTGAPLTDPASPFSLSTRFGTGDGVTTVFQLNRFINSWQEPVFAVYQPFILDNGVPAGTNTVANAQVTFSVAPTAGHALSWIGWYYFGCAFLQDDLSFEQMVIALFSGKSLKFESLRK